MKNSLITRIFEQPSLFSTFDDVFSNIVDSSVDSYKYRTTLSEKDGGYTLTAQVPGLTKDDISICVDNNLLTIKGEKQVNDNMICSIDKQFSIGKDINESKITASVKDGILNVYIPRRESKKPKTIKIN